jgi:oligopeptide transport system substrate-binding protein
VARLLAIPAAFLILLAGAIVWSGGSARKAADFTYIDRGDIITLDLNQVSYMQDFRMLYAIREGLYSPDANTLRPIPAGATGYDLSEDKKTWTFHLRPAARWTNGDSVTARDYVFSWRRLLEEPGEYTYLFYCIKNAQDYEKAYATGKPFDFTTVGIHAVDDLTLRITLENPVPYLLELMAFPVFYPRNERSMEPFKVPAADRSGKYSYRADYTRPAPRAGVAGGAGVVTNGPYELKVWDFKRRLILEKSDSYWDKASVTVNRIEKSVNESALGQYLSFQAGAAQWMSDVQPDLAAELLERHTPELKTSPAFGSMFLTLMCRPELPDGRKNPLADVRVRQALAMSVDKKFIVDNITRIGELPARTYLPPDGTLPNMRWLPGPYDTSRKADQPYDDKEFRQLLTSNLDGPGPGLPRDLARAKQLLAEAGYPDGKGFPPLPILYNSDNQMRAKIAQTLKSQWKSALGIDFTIETVEVKTFKERVSKKDYVIATAAWYGDYPDVSTFTDKYLSPSLQNDSNWVNPAYDDLVHRAAREPDPAARIKLLSQAENMIDTECPVIPIFHYVNTYLVKPTVHNMDPNPRSVVVFKALRLDAPSR